MKTVKQIMQECNAEENIKNFKLMQSWSYSQKIRHAKSVALTFAETAAEKGMNCHVSVGGLDSICLHYFLEDIGISIPCISCSSLEQKGVQAVHRQIAAEMETEYADWYALKGALSPQEVEALKGTAAYETEKNILAKVPLKPEFVFLRPLLQMVNVIKQYGWPVLSKEIAGKISTLQNPTCQNATVRHAILTGETGEYGGWQKSSRMKLAQKWLDLFGGSDPEGSSLGYQSAPFQVSEKCCYFLKEKPCEDWAKKNRSVPFLGLMASEGGRRQKSLMLHGCNYWGQSTIRSAPFAIFNRQDLLRLALNLSVPVPEEYGKIVQDPDGTLRTTMAQRTGCTMCGFGIHLENRPHRFDRLRQKSPKEWDFWMNHVCQDEDGEWYGWGRILNYIGVEWENEPGQINGQTSLF